jgi:hypothetical protein
MEHASQVKMVI